MARIPEDELERIKREVPIARLLEAHGVELKRVGKDLRGRCPFHHPDEDPSLSVDPERNVFHCFGCGAKGSVIDLVMLLEGVSFRHAVEILRGAEAIAAPPATGDQPPAARVAKRSIAQKLPVVVEAAASDGKLLADVARYYHETLKRSPEALEYIEQRGLHSSEVIEHFMLGYSNRTLGYHIPRKAWKDGQTIRGRLAELGVIKDTGHELLRGSLTIPIFNGHGEVVQIYGRKIRDDLRKGTPDHLYLPGPRRAVWNLPALACSKEVILCEALIDALTFWCAGFRNVTTSYGVNGFTEGHLEAFKAYGAERVLIAYDRDDAGDKAALALAERLMAEGLECFRVVFPHGMDANDFACKVQPASHSLAVLLRSAQWMGRGHPPAHPDGRWEAGDGSDDPIALDLAAAPLEAPATTDQRPATVSSEPASFLAAASEAALEPDEEAEPIDVSDMVEVVEPEPPEPDETSPAPSPAAPPPTPPPATLPPSLELRAAGPASPVPPPPRPDIPADVTQQEVVIRLGDRRWRVRGLAKNTAYDVLKVNLLVGSGERFHVDTLNLYSARQRAIFASQAAAELEVKEEVVKHDLGKVLLKLEALQDQLIKKALEPKTVTVAIPDHERAEALAFLQDPKLLDRISADFATCGLVGEQTNTLVGYLAAVSRKLDRPLAVLVQSSSAAGKSALMEAVLAFVPEEERVHYSAMTGQSLFYMGETDLRHKVLAIAEEEGAERASYPLKLLQSEGELTIASTGKDPSTGKLVTHEYHVEGPSAILLTTTAIDLDEELQNRCLVLAVDESREQTEAIHQAQRLARTQEGARAKRRRPRVLTLHRNAQRLLRPLEVRNPYSHRLTFLSDTTRTRRDHEKYLTLIDAIALLHQHQREVRADLVDGERQEYIEATLDDIAIANRLASEAIGRTLDELPPQTRRFLADLHRMVRERCAERKVEQRDLRFSRWDIRRVTGWSYPQVRRHLDRLVDMEYLLVHRGGRGQSFVYELLWAGEGTAGAPFVMGLLDVEKLRKPEPTTLTLTPSGPTLTPTKAKLDPSLTPHCPPVDPPLPPEPLPEKRSPGTAPDEIPEQKAENARHPHTPKSRPYVVEPGRTQVAATAKKRGK